MKLHKIEKGRYVIYFGKDYDSNQLRFEISRTYNFGLGLKFTAEESERQISLYCWRIFSLWISLGSHSFKYRNDPLTTGIVWQSTEHVLRIELLNQREMDSSMPAVIDKYWNYRDWLFGRPIHSESRHRKTDKVEIKMPEGIYMCNVDLWTSYWHRPRSPLTKAVDRIELTPEKPIPIPGKGENSYDLDEDATYSSTMPRQGRTVEECAESLRQSTMERRERYGGKNWLPEVAR
jgi:hypothetical protein